jgi:hypothetical protein
LNAYFGVAAVDSAAMTVEEVKALASEVPLSFKKARRCMVTIPKAGVQTAGYQFDYRIAQSQPPPLCPKSGRRI